MGSSARAIRCGYSHSTRRTLALKAPMGAPAKCDSRANVTDRAHSAVVCGNACIPLITTNPGLHSASNVLHPKSHQHWPHHALREMWAPTNHNVRNQAMLPRAKTWRSKEGCILRSCFLRVHPLCIFVGRKNQKMISPSSCASGLRLHTTIYKNPEYPYVLSFRFLTFNHCVQAQSSIFTPITAHETHAVKNPTVPRASLDGPI